MNKVELCGMPVRVNDAGMISLTDMWKASGGGNTNRPKYFLENTQTQRFIDSFPKGGIPPLEVVKGGNAAGTWGHKKLAYKYAGWIDPDFEHGVFDILDQYFSGKLVEAPVSAYERLMRLDQELKVRQPFARVHASELAQHRWFKERAEKEAGRLIGEFQLTLGLGG